MHWSAVFCLSVTGPEVGVINGSGVTTLAKPRERAGGVGGGFAEPNTESMADWTSGGGGRCWAKVCVETNSSTAKWWKTFRVVMTKIKMVSLVSLT